MNTIIACSSLSWLWSPKDYWYAAVSAVIGAVMGILWAKRQFEKQMAHLQSTALERLKGCVQFNLDRLKQAMGQLEKGIVPNYPLDTVQFNHWLAQSHDSLPADLIRDLDWQRFQLDHISSKFIVVNNAIVTTAGQRPSPEQLDHRMALVRSLAEHVATVLRELPPLLEKIPTKD